MSTAMAEREVDAASTSIRDSISSVANMSGLGFLDSTGKSLTISDPDNRSCDVSYFTFRSSLNRNNVDHCALNAVNQFEFSSRLFDNLPSSSVNISLPSPSIVPNQSSVHIFNATLSGLTDDQLNKMLENEMRDTLSAQRASLFTSVPSNTSRSLNFFTPNFSTTTVIATSTPKMDISVHLLLSAQLTPNPLIFWTINPVLTIFLDLLRRCYLLLLSLFSCDRRVRHSSFKTLHSL